MGVKQQAKERTPGPPEAGRGEEGISPGDSLVDILISVFRPPEGVGECT